MCPILGAAIPKPDKRLCTKTVFMEKMGISGNAQLARRLQRTPSMDIPEKNVKRQRRIRCGLYAVRGIYETSHWLAGLK